MAERKNMTETPLPPGAVVTPSGLVAVGRHAQETVAALRPPEQLRPPEDPLLSSGDRRRIEEQAAHEGGSMFAKAKATFDHYSRGIFNYIRVQDLPPNVQTELQRRREETRGEVVKLKQELESERGGNTVLEHFRRAALEFLKRVRAARPQERHGGEDRGSIINRGRQGYYGEVVFDDSPELRELQAKYGRLPSYMFEGVVQEIDKEAHHRPSPPLNPLVEQEYPGIKQRRERERRREKKYTEIITTWGRYYELLWPESPRDMIDSGLDFVRDQISEVGNRDVGTVSKLLDEIRGKVVELLGTCRVRLNSDEWFRRENKEIIETDPNFLRARAFGEGVTDVLGNEKVMYKGNTEYGPQYKERFAAEFIAHHDEMYMGNPKAARMLRSLSKKGVNPNSRGGFDWSTYWFGHGWDVEKADEGEIADHRRAIEEEIVEDAATHDLFLSDDMTRGLYLDETTGNPILGKDGRPIGAFEYREGGNLGKRDLRFSFDDNIETLLFDPDDRIMQRIAATGDNEALARHDLRVKVFRRIRERLDEREGLGFVSNQERRQREGQLRRPLTDKELLARAEHHKNTRRAEIQQHLRSQGYSEDQIAAQADQIEVQIRSEMEARRQEAVRERIRREMDKKTGYSFFAPRSREDIAKYDAAKAAGDLATCNQIVWDWVKDYNEYRISFRLPRWYPSGWDRTRWNIDRPTKVLDRGLSEEEFEAMFEPIDPGKLDDATISISQHKEDARFGFQLARSYQIFLMQDTLLGGMRTRLRDPKTGEYIGKLADDDETNKRLGLIKVDDQGNIIRDAEGNSIAINPDRKMIRVFDVIQARLQAAIEEEAAVIEQARAEKETAREEREAAIASRDQAAIEAKTKAFKEKTEVLRDIFVNSQFAATHALKEIGLVEGKLPVWSYNFLDRSTIYAFTEVLADYGVEVARGVRISHNSKKEFYESMERGRRAVKAEYDRAAQEFMEGRYPVFERDIDGQIIFEPELDKNGNPIIVNGQPRLVPKQAISLFTAASDWGEPGVINERNRVVSKGGVKEDTQVTDPMFDISTSGGVIFTEAIPWMGDLGFYSLLIWLGVTDIRELHGYIKRRDESEFHRHKFFDVMDPVNHARAQAAAYLGRRALTGGEIDKKGTTTPGFFMEPYHGAFKGADWLHNLTDQARALKMVNTVNYIALMQQGYRTVGLPYSRFIAEWSGEIKGIDTKGNIENIEVARGDLERLRQLSYSDLDKLTKPQIDELYTTLYGVLDYFQLALKATREVQSNRIGNAPRNWVEDNTIKWYRFRREMRKAMQRRDPEKGFIIRQGYSPEVASEIAIRLMEVVLHDGDFYILRPYEMARRATDGAQILSKMLTPAERQQGFEIRDENGQVRKTWVIPEEKDWPNLVNPEVRKALENIRRRGLLEFMREEGYKIYDVEVDATTGIKHLKKVDKAGKPVRWDDPKGQLKELKEVLGQKIPPLVQGVEARKDVKKVISWE